MVLSDGQAMELAPLISACRPKAKMRPKALRRTISGACPRQANRHGVLSRDPQEG